MKLITATDMSEKSDKIKIVYRKIDELVDSEYNPKKCSPKEEAQIEASIKRFGIVDPLIINMNPERKNIIIGGHQRKRICKNLGWEEIPCVELNLDKEKEKELNLRLTKNTASIDDALLAINFAKEMLVEVGFNSEELKCFKSDFEQQLNSITNKDVPYPLVPKFSEKYDAFIIISKNAIDSTYLKTKLNIGKAQSYKNSRTGEATIITVDQFREAVEK